MVGELHVFDVHQDYMTSDTKAYKVRKSHTKSRLGCKTCKIRRVKCDERKPFCTPCLRRSMLCAYPGSTQTPLPLWPGRKTPPVLANDSSAFTTDHDIALLHHFISVVGPHMYSEKALETRSIDIFSLARGVPHVMHAVLAAAALHLNANSPTRSHAVVETGHWVQASASFRDSLSSMTNATNPDPILTTCMLLNLLSFANVGSRPITSRWPFTPSHTDADPQHNSLQWLSVQLGLAPILTSLSEKTKGQSIWLPLFKAANATQIYDNRDGTIDIPPSWCSLFSITATSLASTHPYLLPVRRVTLLRGIYDATENSPTEDGRKPDHDPNCLQYIQFIQPLTSAHIRLLNERDPLMLLLYAHWTALLCAVTHWWCRPRATTECASVVRYLDKVHGAWLGVEGWLDFPARAVGYELTWKTQMNSDDDVGGDLDGMELVGN